MKRGTRDDTAPAAPPPPRSMGALTCLPEVLVGHVCAFLPCRDIKRLRTTCTALRREPPCTPATITLARWPYEEDRDRRLAALTRLARHAAPVVKELRFGRAQLVEPLLVAVLAGAESLPSLTCLHLSVAEKEGEDEGEDFSITERVQMLLGEALAAGRLPALRELQLNYGFGKVVGRLEPVWKALRQGACPFLERLELELCGADELGEAVLALRLRRDRGLPDLKALVVGSTMELSDGSIDEDVAADLLDCLSPASLQELQIPVMGYDWSPVLAPFLQRDCPALRTLKLTIGLEPMPGDELLQALADGAAPGLTDLTLAAVDCSEEAWRAVAEAMGIDSRCLRRLQKLELGGAFDGSFGALECFMRGLGEGHGCPDLHSLSLYEYDIEVPCGTVVAQAFRAPHGLPRLRHLRLSRLQLSDLDQLVLSLQHRPHALQPIEKLDLEDCRSVSASVLGGLGRAMCEGQSLAGLKDLLLNYSVDDEEEWEVELVKALASGAGRQLEVIAWRGRERRRVQVINRFLRALAWRGACPVLKSLQTSSHPNVCGLDMAALGALLKGGAPCSSTLRSVELKFCKLGREEMQQLASCLHHPRVVELEALHLVVAADGAAFLPAVLGALKGRAGRRMEELSVILLDSTAEMGKQVVSLLRAMISSGGLPNIRTSGVPGLDVHVRQVYGRCDVGVDGLRRAVRDRAL